LKSPYGGFPARKPEELSSSPTIAVQPLSGSFPTADTNVDNSAPERRSSGSPVNSKPNTPTSTISDIDDDAGYPNLEGYLDKKPEVGVIRAWRKRWFCLREDKLIYYKESEHNKKGNLLGFIPLREAVSIEPREQDSSSTRFDIKTKERIWLLRAETIEIRDKWIEGCTKHANYQEDKASIPTRTFLTDKDMTQRTGHLDVLFRQTWKTRWFELRNGILYKYRMKDDGKPKKFPLVQCYLEEYNPEEVVECVSFRLGTKNKVFTLRAANADEMHDWLNAIICQKSVVERAVTKPLRETVVLTSDA
jgi:hypothetical protein